MSLIVMQYRIAHAEKVLCNYSFRSNDFRIEYNGNGFVRGSIDFESDNRNGYKICGKYFRNVSVTKIILEVKVCLEEIETEL